MVTCRGHLGWPSRALQLTVPRLSTAVPQIVPPLPDAYLQFALAVLKLCVEAVVCTLFPMNSFPSKVSKHLLCLSLAIQNAHDDTHSSEAHHTLEAP